MIGLQQNWGVIQIKPKRENVVKRQLCEAGLCVYQPLIRSRVAHFGKRVMGLTPMFPGYLFVKGIDEFNFNTVRYCRGVQRVLGNQDRIWTLRDEYVQDLFSREIDGVVQLKRSACEVNSGDPVTVSDGPFEGWGGVFREHLADGERVRIMLTHVNFSTVLVVPKSCVVMGNGLAIK